MGDESFPISNRRSTIDNKSLKSLLQVDVLIPPSKEILAMPYIIRFIGRCLIVMRKHRKQRSNSIDKDEEVHTLHGAVHKQRTSISLTAMLHFPETDMTSSCSLNDVQQSSFNVFTKSHDQLKWYAIRMFDSLGLLYYFRIHPSTFQDFITAICSKYNDNPYHNFKHAFNVLHVSYRLIFISKNELDEVLTPLDILAVLVAALGHDADHPGHDNQSEIYLQSDLSMCYNDVSVLEHHHAAVTFSILKDKKTDIFSRITVHARRLLRQSIIDCILSTGKSRDCVYISNYFEFLNCRYEIS